MPVLLQLVLIVHGLGLPLLAVPPARAAAVATVQVVLHVEGLDEAAMGRMVAEVGRDRTTTIEYSCTWSGVLVLRFVDAPVSERADAVTMTRRLLAKVGIEHGVEFLHIKLEAQGPGKC
jgi:hypothetical protein